MTKQVSLNEQVQNMAANLATLNDIVYALVCHVSDDPDFIELVKSVLKMHSRSLGFEFLSSKRENVRQQ